MKKFLCVLFLVLLFAGCAAAGVRIGILSEMGVPENEAKSLLSATWRWSVLRPEHGDDDQYRNYPSLVAMLMALNAGEVDELDMPEVVAEYTLNNVPDLTVSCVMRSEPVYLAFGFLEKNADLRQKFSDALTALESNGTLDALRSEYIDRPGKEAPEPVKFEKFDGAETVKVAVTGDLPPIDFIAANGEPMGFSTAVLAEIGAILKVNIATVNVETGARTAALASGRADVAFWYEFMANHGDLPKGIILSKPYYNWTHYLQLRKK